MAKSGVIKQKKKRYIYILFTYHFNTNFILYINFYRNNQINLNYRVRITMNFVKVDPIQVINMDCLGIIFSYLDPTSMKNASLVSRLIIFFLNYK